MSEQTEAQRLADLLDVCEISKTGMGMAAEELRRLDAENTELQLYKNLAEQFGLTIYPDLEAIQSNVKGLEADKAELLEALEYAAKKLEVAYHHGLSNFGFYAKDTREVITKHGGTA